MGAANLHLLLPAPVAALHKVAAAAARLAEDLGAGTADDDGLGVAVRKGRGDGG